MKFKNEPVGRREIMKGLTALVAGISAGAIVSCLPKMNPQFSEKLYDSTLVGVTASAILFLGYTIKGVYQTIRSEINHYRDNSSS